MSGIALLCSGQGSQSSSMFDVLASRAEAQSIFSACREVLGGRDPRQLVNSATADEIHQNHLAQILCCTHALAWWAALKPHVEGDRICAGYSVGEVAAWSVCGIIDADRCLSLVQQRAALMDEMSASQHGLAAVLGLPKPTIESLARESGVAIAIVNGRDHFVIGGDLTNLRIFLDKASELGARRTVLLPVKVASHTPLLHDAAARLRPIFADEIGNAKMPRGVRLLSGIDGLWVRNSREGAAKLAAQVSTMVDWAACMDGCRSANPSRILELGPGDALTRMFEDEAPDIPKRSVSSFRSVDGVVAWLKGA